MKHQINFILMAFLLLMVIESEAIEISDIVFSDTYKNQPLKTVLLDIENQFNIKFSYLDNLVKGEFVNASFKNKKLAGALKKILRRTNLSFMIYNESRNIVIYKIDSAATKYTINGSVLDAVSNEPLIAANVQILETKTGTITNNAGSFSLTLYQPATLKISYIGYKVKRVDIDKSIDNIQIRMTPSAVFLNALVVYPNAPDMQEMGMDYNLEPKNLNKVSGPFQDAIVAMKTLPGVSSRGYMEAKYSVRGGNPDENLVLVNNTTVYSPFHLKWNKYGMSVGIFNLDLVDKVQLSSGGFSAKYGDKLSSLLLIDYREGNKDRIHGKVLLTIPDSRIILDGPVSKKINFIFGARLFPWALILKRVVKAPDNFDLNYWDIHNRIVYRPTQRNKLSLLYIRSGDKLIWDDDYNHYDFGTYTGYVFGNKKFQINETRTDFSDRDATFKTELLSFTWENMTSHRNILKCKLSYYNDYNDDYDRDDLYINYIFGNDYFVKKQYFNAYYLNLNMKNYEISIEDDFLLSENLEINSGIEYQLKKLNLSTFNENYREDITNYIDYPNISVIWRDTTDTAINQIQSGSYHSNKITGYIQSIYHLNNRLSAGLGYRSDYYEINKQLTMSPRVNLSYLYSENTNIRIAWGYFFQPPQFYELKKYNNSADNTKCKSAIHYILGVERNIKNNLFVKIEGYYKKLSNLISEEIYDPVNPVTSRQNDTKGFCTGIDLQFRYSGRNTYSSLSYGFLNAKENNQYDAMGYYPRSTDQRHTLVLLGGCKLPKNWNMSTQIVYGSGYAYTPQYKTGNGWIFGEKNSTYFPGYYRVDLRIEKQTRIFNHLSTFFLDIYNVTYSKQVYSYTYSNDGEKNGEGFSPIFPFLGISIKF